MYQIALVSSIITLLASGGYVIYEILSGRAIPLGIKARVMLRRGNGTMPSRQEIAWSLLPLSVFTTWCLWVQIDFSLFLVLASLITGIIWLVDVVTEKKIRREVFSGDQSKPVRESLIVEYSRSFFPVLVIVLVLRTAAWEPFRIPSGSMMPSLLVGDFILVNKHAYGIRLPVVDHELIESGKPERGDVAVFRFPDNPSLDYIKRIIGLPGDEIGYFNKTLMINGTVIQKTDMGAYEGEDYTLMRPPVRTYREKVGKHTFNTLEQQNKRGQEGLAKVPDGHYFVMGDNRDNSNDSRYWGYVPAENMVGRADRIWMSWDSEDYRIRFERVGQKIDE